MDYWNRGLMMKESARFSDIRKWSTAALGCVSRSNSYQYVLSGGTQVDSGDPHNPIENLLNDLDEAALQWQVGLAAETSWQCRRDKWRRLFRVPCEVWAFTGADGMLKHQGAHTRNISERGVALLAADPVLKGMPVEIRISVASRPRIHLAGLVAYCRSTVHDMQEIGVLLKVQQGLPVFHDDPRGAMVSIPWIRDAMRDLPMRSRIKHSFQ